MVISDYVADLRSSDYRADVQYVTNKAGEITCLLIGDYRAAFRQANIPGIAHNLALAVSAADLLVNHIHPISLHTVRPITVSVKNILLQRCC